jgi:mannose-1-phosphate guanylyltransferase
MLIPVILSGGAGTRLWPVSRAGHPKPFMKLPDGETLLRKSFLRAAQLAEGGELVTVTNRDYFFISKDELDLARPKPSFKPLFLLEPVGRNTAAAIALTALYIQETHGDDAVMLAMAADHLILNENAFFAAVRQAEALAAKGQLVTFGAKPDRPETGYGYIACGEAIDDRGACKVAQFTEKPTLQVAQQFLADGRYFWNCGIFCFSVGAVLRELQEHAPRLVDAAQECWKASRAKFAEGSSMLDLDPATFGAIESISIDYAVMEKSSNVAVVPCDFGWSDIGSWAAISSLVEPDGDDNRVIGDAVVIDSTNTFIQTEDRLVAAVGVKDLLIIETSDAVLVADRSRAQDVKKVVDALKAKGHESYKTHRTVARPWGTYTVLEEGPHFKIKRIVVKPGAALSLQMHHHRSEHWVVVSGTAKVVNGEQELVVQVNQSTYIPAGNKHRLENPGTSDLVLIEVQSGDYLGEDDIVRFSDRYGRAA